MAEYISRHFVPLRAHIKEHAQNFKRFDVLWTPTVLVLDSDGAERFRLEGYLPRDEFNVQIRLGLARVSFMQRKWEDAEHVYDEILGSFPGTRSAAEAQYWRGVCRYKRKEPDALPALTEEFRHRYQDSLWAKKASIWGK